jgi:monoamine oxidase
MVSAQRLFALHEHAKRTGVPVAEILGALEAKRARDRWVHGAYSYYRVGQASTYGQVAGASEGRFLFAGEHTSIDSIGFMNGAVKTGERAARRLMRQVGL